jgi:hypothetical protein
LHGFGINLANGMIVSNRFSAGTDLNEEKEADLQYFTSIREVNGFLPDPNKFLSDAQLGSTDLLGKLRRAVTKLGRTNAMEY